MQRKITRNLIIIAIFGFLLSCLVIYGIQQRLASDTRDEQLSRMLINAAENIDVAEYSASELEGTINEDCLARARSLAQLYQLSPAIFLKEERIDEICEDLKLAEAGVTNANGIIVYSSNKELIGQPLSSDEQQKKIERILNEPNGEVIQRTQHENGEGVKLFYAGVERLDKRGIVFIAIASERYEIALESARISTVLSHYPQEGSALLLAVGADGIIQASSNGQHVGTALDLGTQEDGLTAMGGETYCYDTLEHGDLLLVALVLPTDTRGTNALYMFMFALMMFALFTVFVVMIVRSIRINIIQGLDETMETLEEVASGNLNVVAKTYTNPEFAALSNGVNDMLESIKENIRVSHVFIHQLGETKAQAEFANRAKSMFLANMSHELRTPMNGIVGFTQLAMQEELTSPLRQCLSDIETCTATLLSTINGILDISKIEAGRVEPEYIDFSLQEVFASLCAELEGEAAKRNNHLTFDVDARITRTLKGDPTLLKKALHNLVASGIKSARDGCVQISARVLTRSERLAAILFNVADDGAGMNSEQFEQMFEPFTKGDGADTLTYEETGLGLSITRDLVALMGGELKAESAAGEGSRFFFKLGFGLGDELSCAQVAIAHRSLERKPHFEGNVLVCEDDSINQKVIEHHLTNVGINPIIASNGREGVDILARCLKDGTRIELILMDLYMPVMGGLDATACIRELGVRTPIVAMTSDTIDNCRKACEAHDIRDFIPKPFITQDLWECLESYIENINV